MPKSFKIINVVGARPNFMKVAPIHSVMTRSEWIDPLLVHTGQHYDTRMSEAFFQDLGLARPDEYLGVGSGSHAQQTAKAMVEFEKICLQESPDLVLVVGDVNSTLACSLTACKLGIPVAHVEAGLRSFDSTMPEEINRILTDAISDYLFIHSPEAQQNLVRENVEPGKIHLVGNVMIDSLLRHLPQAEERYQSLFGRDYPPGRYGVVTLHRPSNVDEAAQFRSLLEVLERVSLRMPLIFPVHPRTRKELDTCDDHDWGGLLLTEPLGYRDFLGLLKNAGIVITDSGGIQEETTFLNIPCVTVRENTERPITISSGSNVLAGCDPESVFKACLQQLDHPKAAATIPLWDGGAADRIVEVLLAELTAPS